MFFCLLLLSIFNTYSSKLDSLMSKAEDVLSKDRISKIKNIDEYFSDEVKKGRVLETIEREKSIIALESFLNKYKESVYIPETKYRLGELYFERALDNYINSIIEYERSYQKKVNVKEPVFDYDSSINILKDFKYRYQDYEERPDALYLLGYLYIRKGQPDEAYNIINILSYYSNYNKTIDLKSKLAGYYFIQGNYKKAESYYLDILKVDKNNEQSLYSLAWIYNNSGNCYNTSKYFISFIELIDKKDFVSDIKEEAKDVIALCAFKNKKDIIFLENVLGEGKYYSILSKYTMLSIEAGRIKESRKSIDLLLKKFPYEKDNAFIFDKFLELFSYKDNFSIKQKEVLNFYSFFNRKSSWYKQNSNDKSLIKETEDFTAKNIFNLAEYVHYLGDRDKRKDSYKIAKDFYDIIDFYYQDTSYYIKALLAKAEILYKLGNYSEALNAYERIESLIKEEDLFESLFYGLLSSKIKVLEVSMPKYKNRKLEPEDSSLSQLEISVLDALSKYEKVPGAFSDRLDYVWQKKGEIYFRNNLFSESRESYLNVVKNSTSDKEKVNAMKAIALSYRYEKDYDNSNKWLKEASLLEKDKKKQDDLEDFLASSIFTRAKDLESKGLKKEAADEYKKIVFTNPKHKYADSALYNSGKLYEESFLFYLANQSYMTLLDKYPTSRHRAVSLYKIALNYEKILDFKNAIFFYNKIIKEFPNQDESMLAYCNLAAIYKAHNEYNNAILNYEICLKKGIKIRENIIIIAELNLKIKNHKRALNLYKYYINKYDDESVRSIYYKKADIYKEISDYTNANRVYNELGFKNLNSEDKYKILFYRTDSAYNNILSGLKKENISLAPKLIKTYMEISNTSYPDLRMEALYRIGNIFESLHVFDSSKGYLDKSKYYWSKVLEEKVLSVWSEKAKEKLKLDDFLDFNYPYLNGTNR